MITTKDNLSNICLKILDISILSAWEYSGVTSLVHEGPACPLIPRASLGSTHVGVLFPAGGLYQGKQVRVNARVRT